MKHGKLAVFGCNGLALDVARRLEQSDHYFIMIDMDEGRVHEAREEGFRAERLDYTDDEALRKLGLGSDIDGVFCLLDEDSENVFLAITARAIDPRLRIVAICREPEASSKLLAAGADKVVDPYAISGARAYDLIARPEPGPIRGRQATAARATPRGHGRPSQARRRRGRNRTRTRRQARTCTRYRLRRPARIGTQGIPRCSW